MAKASGGGHAQDSLKILIVDDERSYCKVLEAILKAEGYDVCSCSVSAEVMHLIQNRPFDIIISDLIMPHPDGIELLKQVKALRPDIFFVMLTAHGTIENAVSAMKLGAFSYSIKGSDPSVLLREIAIIQKLIEGERKLSAMDGIRESDYMMNSENNIVKEALSIAKKVAPTNANVLILGESGVGKEVIAKYIHGLSARKANRFFAISCQAFASNLLESELFGHVKGAFTGASENRAGWFETASGSTLLIDEIGDLSLGVQTKLLRVLETKTVNRIGDKDDIYADFRLISATNSDLGRAIDEHTFREDLYYRISTIVINIPPLRERREDLPLLIDFFKRKVEAAFQTNEFRIAPEVMRYLLDYSYPGNIRELKNIIERMIILSEGCCVEKDILKYFPSISDVQNGEMRAGDHIDGSAMPKSLKDVRRSAESVYIRKLLQECASRVEVAKILGITQRHLANKMSDYGILADEPDDLVASDGDETK